MILLLFVVGLISFIYYYYVNEIKKYESLFKVPGPRGNFLLGNALDFKNSEGNIFAYGQVSLVEVELFRQKILATVLTQWDKIFITLDDENYLIFITS